MNTLVKKLNDWFVEQFIYLAFFFWFYKTIINYFDRRNKKIVYLCALDACIVL